MPSFDVTIVSTGVEAPSEFTLWTHLCVREGFYSFLAEELTIILYNWNSHLVQTLLFTFRKGQLRQKKDWRHTRIMNWTRILTAPSSRITESLTLEKTSRIKSNCQTNTTKPCPKVPCLSQYWRFVQVKTYKNIQKETNSSKWLFLHKKKKGENPCHTEKSLNPQIIFFKIKAFDCFQNNIHTSKWAKE